MILWQYWQSSGGRVRLQYGAPVECYVVGWGWARLVFQLQPARVVEHSTGMEVADIPPDSTGPWQEQARIAVESVAVPEIVKGAPVLNPHVRMATDGRRFLKDEWLASAHRWAKL